MRSLVIVTVETGVYNYTVIRKSLFFKEKSKLGVTMTFLAP